jgi:hypothetical protein
MSRLIIFDTIGIILLLFRDTVLKYYRIMFLDSGMLVYNGIIIIAHGISIIINLPATCKLF